MAAAGHAAGEAGLRRGRHQRINSRHQEYSGRHRCRMDERSRASDLPSSGSHVQRHRPDLRPRPRDQQADGGGAAEAGTGGLRDEFASELFEAAVPAVIEQQRPLCEYSHTIPSGNSTSPMRV